MKRFPLHNLGPVIAVKDIKVHMLKLSDSIYSFCAHTNSGVEGQRRMENRTYWGIQPDPLPKQPSRCRNNSHTPTDCSAGAL